MEELLGGGLYDPWKAIQKEEFRERQDRARRAALQAGYDGLVIYGKGGAAMDMFAEVFYLTNHYSPIPYVSDHFGLGTARSHSTVVLPVEGPILLVTDSNPRQEEYVADEIRCTTNVTQETARALQNADLRGKRLGLVGASFMSAAAYIGLLENSGDTDLRRADHLIENLRVIKSLAEQAVIRQAVEIGDRALTVLMDAVEEGISEAEAVSAGASVLIPRGAVLYDAACASGPNSHQFTSSHLPSWNAARSLARGELFHVDFYGAYGGYLWDLARTKVVGNSPTDRQYILLETAIGAVEHLCAAIRPGLSGDAVYQNCLEWLQEDLGAQQFSYDFGEVISLVGHGVGLTWETPLLAPGVETLLQTGMHLAVELFICVPGLGGVMYEQDGFVTKNGFEVLSTCPSRWWTK